MIANGGAQNRTAIMADMQSAGVGQRGAKWISPFGNLYVSVILSMPLANIISYEVALSVSDALQHFGVQNKIKWPNDILTDGGKIAGILCEKCGDSMVVGIGINLANAPVADYATANAPGISRDEILPVLLQRLDYWTQQNFENVRDEWTRRAAYVGQDVLLNGAQVKFVGIDENGAAIFGNKKVVGTNHKIVWPVN